jgi:methionine synthase I (cobalamin-dependent)/5,10-methylenetetrahydrofolate reductase
MSITGASVPAAELLSGERVLVCDGAMGTMLHAAGAALDRSLPELNLSDPDLVATIHDSYLSAGADIIQANTFGANRLWLGDHGFPDKVDEINRAGVRLARAACAQAGRPTLVAGSVSPAVTALQRRRVGSAERVEVLREQVLALITEGVDLLILETFGYLDELVEAVSVAASLTDVPLIAQATFADDARTLGGETPREVASVLSALPVAALGTNCTVGPQRMLAVAEDLVRYSSVPVSAQPNAGQPRRVGARTFEFSIDGGYFARYLGRFAAAGVTIVGGCCGTTPTHIRAAAEAVRTAELHASSSSAGGAGFAGLGTGSSGGGVSASSAGLTVSTGATDADAGSVTGAGVLAELLAAGSFVVAASITTPAGGWAGEAEEAAAVFQSRGIGLVAVQPRENARTHMDSLNMALQLQQRVGVETLPTVTSWDKSIMSLQADLLGAHALGIRSVVATTGSPSVFGDYPAVDGTWEVDSLGLAGLLAGLNAGRDSNGLALTSRTSFCIGARVNPGARDPEAEIARAHAKIRAGAQFLVSRPVYEPDSLRALVSALEGTGVPLLLSMTPLRSFEEADYLAHEVPGVTIPASVLDSLEKAGRGAARSVGIALATDLLAQVRPLVRGVILTAPDDDATAILPLIDALR